jgi:hypothetical protein
LGIAYTIESLADPFLRSGQPLSERAERRYSCTYPGCELRPVRRHS